jgi:hypothetical protein
MEKQWIIVIVVVLGALLLADSGFAAGPVPPVNLNVGTSSSRNLSGLSAQQIAAQAGNVTQVDISALSITKSWQGYYGNVTGAIALQDANNKTFYNWSVTSNTGKVYATRTTSVNFATVNCTPAANLTTEETFLGQVAADADSVSKTFTKPNTHPTFGVGSVSIETGSCYATNAFDSTGAQTANYFQVLLADANGAGNIIYTTLMNGSKTGFNNQAWDFELLVGQNGHAGGPSTTTYYFYVELN